MSSCKTYYQVGKKLGLSQTEIKNVLNSYTNVIKQPKSETGPRPPMYTSCFYGSISIKDF